VQVNGYVISRLKVLAPSEKPGAQAKRKQRAKALALLAVLLKLLSCGSRLRAPSGDEGYGPGGVEGLARKLRVGRPEVLDHVLDQFYHVKEEGGSFGSSTDWVLDKGKRDLLVLHALLLALAVDEYSLATGQFEELRGQLKMTSQELAARFRELGCSCLAIRGAPGAGAAAGYTVTLLQQQRGSANRKTLAECLPKPKTGPAKRR
jgi:hypothetical protein